MIFLEGYRKKRLQPIVASAFEILGLEGNAMVEFKFFSRSEMRKLNASMRGVDRVTDVLSFPALSEIKPFTIENYPFDFSAETNSVFLGSIVICSQVCKEQAQRFEHSYEREFFYLFTHGLLHLLGFDHENEKDKHIMRDIEEKILSLSGVMTNENRI